MDYKMDERKIRRRNNDRTEDQPISWNRVCLQKLTLAQLIKTFPSFYGIKRYIPCSQKSAPLVSIASEMNPIRILTTHFLKIHFILFSYSCLVLSNGLLPSGFLITILGAVLIRFEKTEKGKHNKNEKRQGKIIDYEKERRKETVPKKRKGEHFNL
jgi:hypothetical protein